MINPLQFADGSPVLLYTSCTAVVDLVYGCIIKELTFLYFQPFLKIKNGLTTRTEQGAILQSDHCNTVISLFSLLGRNSYIYVYVYTYYIYILKCLQTAAIVSVKTAASVSEAAPSKEVSSSTDLPAMRFSSNCTGRAQKLAFFSGQNT